MPQRSSIAERKRRTTRGAALALLAVGILLLATAGLRAYLHHTALRLSDSVAHSYQAHPSEVDLAIPTHVTVMGVIDTDLTAEVYMAGKWTVADSTGSYLTSSARPGQPGNIIVYGHNKSSIFGKFPMLRSGQSVVLATSSHHAFDYRIINVAVVDPTDTSYLQPTNTETLTMYTCTGFLDSKRLIVQAMPQKRL